MGHNNTLLRLCRLFASFLPVILTICLFTQAVAAQTTASREPATAWSEYLKQHPRLLPEITDLFTRVQHDVQLPAARNRSTLLPALPESTQFYVALPNYGDAAHQLLTIFREQLKVSPALREWWQHGELGKSAPEIEDSLDKFYLLSQFLGNEIVISGAAGTPDFNSVFAMAEVRKPGLKEFLQLASKDPTTKSLPGLRILDPRELPVAKDQTTANGLVVLVRPDFVVAGTSVETLRHLNGLIDSKNAQFAGTPFGQRLAQSYGSGPEILAAADLQKLLSRLSAGPAQNRETLDRSGFGDAKYLVWEHKSVPGQPASQTELSFNGPRHGVASWLASPAPLNSLDFVSPRAIMSATIVLKNLAEIFDDIKQLSATANPNAFASLDQMEQAMNISLKNDLLKHLDGEITLEVDSIDPPDPVWKAILRVNDPEGLQRTFDKLLMTAPVKAGQFEEGGVNYHTLRIPSPQKTVDVVYAFVDGYMVIASSHGTATEAIRMHKTGDSLGRSASFRAALPPGHSAEASGLLYQDPVAMTALKLRQLSPDMAPLFSQFTTNSSPAIVAAYAGPSAIRSVSSSAGMDAGMAMVVAAIAIPNLLRAKGAANESAAVGTIRMLDTAQTTYSASYPEKGFARDFATLGPDPHGPGHESSLHAGLIDGALGNSTCAVGAWCTRSGFRFMLKAVCLQETCMNFVVVGTPVESSQGTRSFCSTSDGVVRFKVGPTLTQPISVSQCRTWQPLR
jgi:hypothetical protein